MVPGQHSAHHKAFIKTMAPFDCIWDGCFRSIKAVQDQGDLEMTDIRLIKSALYGGGSKAREFEKHKNNLTPGMEVFEPAWAKWTPPVVFVPKKHGTMHSGVNYFIFNAMKIIDSYQRP